jgi:hypothetical protein
MGAAADCSGEASAGGAAGGAEETCGGKDIELPF